ncbi:MAG: hypothetical protein M9894_19955 [Planctomycetes bacterium]|nr:hypothetical protein [Planctomycetota bacterium]
MLRPALLAPALACALALVVPAARADDRPLAHLQTDRPAYRLGETVWWRVHVRPGDRLEAAAVRLVDARGVTRAERRVAADAPTGTFLLERAWEGGAYRVELLRDGAPVHALEREVYDVARPALDLSLRVLGALHTPGDEVVASFAAKDLAGRPVVGARVRWLATFGALEVRGDAGPTCAEGRALVRVRVPAEATAGGHLACGLEVGRARAAVAARVDVSASVGAVDLFVEGGGRLTGAPQRFGVLVRDLDGRPAAAEGRVEDDEGQVVASFVADARGLALVEVPCAADRAYRVRIDRPAGVTARFPVPGPSGHEHALRVDAGARGLRATVRGRPGARVAVRLDGAGVLTRTDVRLGRDGEGACTLPVPAWFTRARVTLVVDGKATLSRPVLVGAGGPARLEVKAREGRRLPGDEVVLDVVATLDGAPVAADLALSVYRAALGDAAPAARGLDLAARAALGALADAVPGDLSDLLADDDATALQARRDALALVHDALDLPPEGLPLARGEVLTATEAAPRATPRPITPRPAARPVEDGRSKARPDALEALLRRAAFTRPTRPRAADERRVEPDVAPERLDALAGAGAAAARPPQEARVDGLDLRDTLCWVGRLVTGPDGKGTARFRLSHEVEALAVEAQGFGGGAPLTAAAEVRPRAAFATRFDAPAHLNVGDVVELHVEHEVRDGRDDPLDLRVLAPPALRPLDRTEVVLRPSRAARSTKFRFEAVAPADGAALVVKAARGGFREVTRSALSVKHGEVEVSHAVSGRGGGGRSISVPVPASAVPGSVRVRGQVYPSPAAEAVAGLEALLSEPYGCMEQTTATNYPNVVVLRALMGDPQADPAVLERAYELARKGHARVLTFQDAESGGFALFPGQAPAVRYTCLGIAQLAAYAQVSGGEGTVAMQRALDWLERRERLTSFEALYAAFACVEAGVPWRGLAAALRATPATACERALLANAVALWGEGAWPLDVPRHTLLARLLDGLAPDDRGAVTSEGSGVVFSRGEVLTLETTALAAVALLAGGRAEEGGRALSFLAAARQPHGGWYGTQATALAVRALCAFPMAPPTPATRVRLDLGGGEAVVSALPRAGRPLVLERAVQAAPGQPVRASLLLEGDAPLGYALTCSYRVAAPTSAPRAPYALEVRAPATLQAGGDEALRVTLRPTGAPRPAGQVVARIALPGGCKAPGAVQGTEASRVEVGDGWVTLYYEEAPARPVTFTVPLRGVAPGAYRAAPSVVYAYYEVGTAAYAPGYDLRVLSPFDLHGAAATLGR